MSHNHTLFVSWLYKNEKHVVYKETPVATGTAPLLAGWLQYSS